MTSCRLCKRLALRGRGERSRGTKGVRNNDVTANTKVDVVDRRGGSYLARTSSAWAPGRGESSSSRLRSGELSSRVVCKAEGGNRESEWDRTNKASSSSSFSPASASLEGFSSSPSSSLYQSNKDLFHIQKLWLELREQVSYLTEDELERVRNALQIAYGAHKGQKRKSGDPYIIHPVAVACILGELSMDADSVVAGLLHDVVEDTDKLSFQDIESIFGTNVRLIVEGETKVTKLRENHKKTAASAASAACAACAEKEKEEERGEGKTSLVFSKNEKNAIDMQQLFIAMTKEVRIIIVKLADRLHNMRTLKHMPSHKQKKIAQETLTIFAPLANLLGLHKIQVELEDLSFKYSQPDEYRALKNRVRVLKMDQSPVVYEARKALKSVLKEDPFFQQIACEVDIRMCNRSLYNIHKKLKSNDLQLRDLQNIAQLHVIATPRTDLATLSNISGGKVSAVDRQVCYYLLGKVHEIWAPIPGKFKDFIATPKGNNYQSLHTTVIPLGSKDLFPLEIQIRTEVMNRLAETGYAAHRRLVGDIMTHPSSVSVSVPMQPTVKSITNGRNANHLNGNQNGQGSGHVHLTNGNGLSSSSSSSSSSRDRDLYTEEVLWQTGWLNAVKDWQKEFVGSVTAQEFVETVVGDFLPRTIFVFTPDGTLVSLPKGATIVDFAYQIHSNVGNQMLMAKVNGVPTHPSHELKLAEVIEVVRHNGPPTHYILKRQKEYLNYAKSRSTRHKILKFLKTHADILAQAPVSKKKEALKSAMKNRVYNDDNDLTDIISPYRRGEVLWLILKCQDQVGLLANVSTIISSSGLSIRAYSGSANDYSKVFLMNFELIGRAKASKLKQMCETLNDLDSILSFAIGCNWSPPNILH